MAKIDLSRYKLDLHPSPYDPNDFRVDVDRTRTLPTAAMLDGLPPIRDQGQEGSCWGFAGTAAREVDRIRAGVAAPLSPAFLYWQTRHIAHEEGVDAGSNLRSGLRAMHRVGICEEQYMPYVAGDFAAVPPASATLDARHCRIASYHRIQNLHELKYVLAIGKRPVVLGTPVYRGWEESGDGVIPLPALHEEARGGHAILTVGYNDIAATIDPRAVGGGYLILPNSWGVLAGDHGRYYMPYAYAFNDQMPWFEAWTFFV